VLPLFALLFGFAINCLKSYLLFFHTLFNSVLFAPAARSNFVISRFPLLAAMWSGVSK